MSRYVDRYKTKTANTPLANIAAADPENLPILSELMCGVRSQDGKTWEMPPHTVTVWLEGSMMKFAIGAGEFYDKCFGTTDGLSTGFAGIERALDAERCEWKPPKGRK